MDAKFLSKVYNNIHILITETKTDTLCGVEYSLKHGSMNENKNENNMTHMVEHLLASFINKTNCNQLKILDTLYLKNTKTNASVSKNYTTVYINGLYVDFEYYIDIMLGSLYNLCFTKKILEIEKNAIIQELKQKINNNYYDYYYKINKYMCKNYNHYADGIKIVRNLSINQIKKYYENEFINKPIYIAISCPEHKLNETYTHTLKALKKYVKQPIPLKKNKKIALYKPSKNEIIWIENKILNSSIIKINVMFHVKMKYLSMKHLCYILIFDYYFNFQKGPFYEQMRRKNKIIYSIKPSLEFINENAIINIETNTTKFEEFLKFFKSIFEENIDITKFDIIKKRIINNIEYTKFNNLHSARNFYLQSLRQNNTIVTYSEYATIVQNINSKIFIKYMDEFRKSPYILFYYNDIKII
jgi:predicted Zn-dependent peptidase